MSRTALSERIGTVLTLVEKDNSRAEIVRSYKISGDFPKHPGIEVVFDFAKESEGSIVVNLTRMTGGRSRTRKNWTLTAIADRDAVGLAGFKDFAESLGLKGAQLANLITGLYVP
ncbi:MAG TPA: hypothetical protein VN665_03495 [Candidatus Paceibacterota bacterium]|nr:hypothetical protein [Candidatus Paceibacterota bacterium]